MDRRIGRFLIAGVSAVAGFFALPAAATASVSGFVVQASTAADAARAVVAAGGTVNASLGLVHGVTASLPDRAAAQLSSAGLVVTPDATLRPLSDNFSDGTPMPVQLAALDPGPTWSPHAGTGPSVALLDTGVDDTPALAGHLVQGPDLSGEGDGIDHYGHGTFMAGLIAGNGAGSPAGTRYSGVAPGATVVSVKVAGADGTTTLSRVLAGLQWVVDHRDDLHIRVVNLSFGVSGPPVEHNPLDAAVEAVWASRITVVAAAGNDGAGHLTSPGDDPWVITVGASDPHGTAATADDTVPSWSGQGRSKPDVVAPGVSVISLRATGSTIDAAHPGARIGDAYFRGSGTSMATALTSGAAAVLVADHPQATPDDIKGALVDGGTRVPSVPGVVLDLAGADRASGRAGWWQQHPVIFTGLPGGMTHSMPWTAASWTAASWTAASWTAASWTAASWTAASWTAASWTAEGWG